MKRRYSLPAPVVTIPTEYLPAAPMVAVYVGGMPGAAAVGLVISLRLGAGHNRSRGTLER